MDQVIEQQADAAAEREAARRALADLKLRIQGLLAQETAMRAQLERAEWRFNKPQTPGPQDEPQKEAVPALEWRIEIKPEGVRFSRFDHGKWTERYATVPPCKAAIYAAAITQGFEPPRALLRQETPAG